MRNEPEKPIEQALLAYARKRQDDAGAPLELHPATRHMLQDEVARTLAKPAGEAPSRLQFLRTAWPRLAFGGAIFATLVFVVVLMQSARRIGSGGSTMELAQHKADPAVHTEFRELSESPATAEKDAKDRDEAVPMSTAGELAQPPPKPMAGVQLESINEAKKDSYARSTPPMPRTPGLAEPATRSREEMTRQDSSFKVKSETAGAKASGTPAAPAVAGGTGGTPNLSRENTIHRQTGDKKLAERRQLGVLLEPAAKPADKIDPNAKPLQPKRAAERSRPAIADEKQAASEGATAESGKLMKLAERDPKLGVDKSDALLAVTPAPALQQGTPVNFATAGGDLRLRFSREDARAKYRQNLNSPPVPNVLTTFQIERAGNAIRIIDADGSTYLGQIIPGNVSVSHLYSDDESVQLPDTAKKESREESLKKNVAQPSTPALAGRAGNAPTAGFLFQAAGTNQTLNQTVEFFGTMVLDRAVTQARDATGLPVAKAKTPALARSNTPANARFAVPSPASGPQTNVVLKQAEILSGKIQGKAVVGGRNQFEIIAVPVTK